MAVVVEPGNVIDAGTIGHVVFAGPPLQLIAYVAFLPLMDCDAGDTATLKSTTRTEMPPDWDRSRLSLNRCRRAPAKLIEQIQEKSHV